MADFRDVTRLTEVGAEANIPFILRGIPRGRGQMYHQFGVVHPGLGGCVKQRRSESARLKRRHTALGADNVLLTTTLGEHVPCMRQLRKPKTGRVRRQASSATEFSEDRASSTICHVSCVVEFRCPLQELSSIPPSCPLIPIMDTYSASSTNPLGSHNPPLRPSGKFARSACNTSPLTCGIFSHLIIE